MMIMMSTRQPIFLIIVLACCVVPSSCFAPRPVPQRKVIVTGAGKIDSHQQDSVHHCYIQFGLNIDIAENITLIACIILCLIIISWENREVSILFFIATFEVLSNRPCPKREKCQKTYQGFRMWIGKYMGM